MAWKIMIGPPTARVDRTAKVRVENPVTISLTQNERTTARFTTVPSYRPNLRDEVLIYHQDGTTVLFGGLVYQRQTESVGQKTFTTCECTDWSIYGDWCFADLTYAAATTLQVVLNNLVGLMGAYGVTLDATNYSSVTLEPFAWANKSVTDCLRELCEKTGYIWRFSTTKVLSLIVPGASAAPFNLSDATPHCATVEWSDVSEKYASKVRIVCGPSGAATATQTWTANGTATRWMTDFPAAGTMPQMATVGGVPKSLAGTSSTRANCYLSMTANPAQGPPYDPSYNFANGETITLAGRTYQFRTTLTDVDGYVLIGATSADSLNHLICAICGYGGAGSTYAASTTPHANITGFWRSGNMVEFRALVAGAAGNAYACTTTAARAKIYGEGNVNITTFQLGSDATAAPYEFDLATHTLMVGTDSVPTNGTSLVLTYEAMYPFTVTAGNDSVPMVEYVMAAPEVMTLAAGQQLADAWLARLSGSQKTVVFTTYDSGLQPGQSLSIVLTNRGLNVAEAFIQTVEIELVSSSWWVYRVTAIEGDEYLGSYLDYFRGGGGGGGTPVLSGSGATIMTGGGLYGLGGSRSLYVAPNPKAWTPVAEWATFKAATSFPAIARAWLWARNQNITISARLTSGTNGIDYGTTVATFTDVTSQSPVERTVLFDAVVNAYYRLEVQPSADGEGAGCLGYAAAL